MFGASLRTKNKLPHIILLNDMTFDIIKNHPIQHEVYVFPAENKEPLKQMDSVNRFQGYWIRLQLISSSRVICVELSKHLPEKPLLRKIYVIGFKITLC